MYMTGQQLSTLDALVTRAAENTPGGLSRDEEEVARIVGDWARDGRKVEPLARFGYMGDDFG